MSAPATVSDATPVGLAVRVVPREDLRRDTQAPTRGYAHVGFAGYPRRAAGHLECGHLRLFADAEMAVRESSTMHPHSDVDDLMVMLSGRCHHEDSLGNAVELGAGDVSLLAAGARVEHLAQVVGDQGLRALVIMLEPDRKGGASAYHRGRLTDDHRPGEVVTFAAGGRFATDGAVPLRSDARVLSVRLRAGQGVEHPLQARADAYVCVAAGSARVEGRHLDAGDRALVEGRGRMRLDAEGDAHVFIVEMPRD